MNKMTDTPMERIANFIEQLVLDKFEVTDEHEFLYWRHIVEILNFMKARKIKLI